MLLVMLIEVTTFSLAPGADRAAFLAADHEFQEELNSQAGLVRRTTAEGDRWLVITSWWDEASADNAARSLADHPSAAAFKALVADVESRRYTDVGG